MLRLSPQVISDRLYCVLTWAGTKPCDSSTLLLVEAVVAYRIAFSSTGGFSIGGAITAGEQRISYTSNPGAQEVRFVVGFLAPRILFDF